MRGFLVFQYPGKLLAEVADDKTGRVLMERQWPSCIFALTRLEALFGEKTPEGFNDILVIAACVPIKPGEISHVVKGYIISTCEDTNCAAPSHFTPTVWSDTVDKRAVKPQVVQRPRKPN